MVQLFLMTRFLKRMVEVDSWCGMVKKICETGNERNLILSTGTYYILPSPTERVVQVYFPKYKFTAPECLSNFSRITYRPKKIKNENKLPNSSVY